MPKSSGEVPRTNETVQYIVGFARESKSFNVYQMKSEQAFITLYLKKGKKAPPPTLRVEVSHAK